MEGVWLRTKGWEVNEVYDHGRMMKMTREVMREMTMTCWLNSRRWWLAGTVRRRRIKKKLHPQNKCPLPLNQLDPHQM